MNIKERCEKLIEEMTWAHEICVSSLCKNCELLKNNHNFCPFDKLAIVPEDFFEIGIERKLEKYS